jgi:protein SCO1
MPALPRRAFLASSTLVAAAPKPLSSWRSQTTSRAAIRERYFPDLVLTTHENKRVRFYEDLIRDKVVTINVFYTKCEGICPGITNNLVKVQRMLGDRVGRDIFMYSITLKPEEDTPEVLKNYAQAYHVGPGWLFLTGNPSDIELLRRKLGFVWADPARDRVKLNHTGNLRYGNERLQLWAACPAKSNPKWIIESLSWVMFPNTKGV